MGRKRGEEPTIFYLEVPLGDLHHSFEASLVPDPAHVEIFFALGILLGSAVFALSK